MFTIALVSGMSSAFIATAVSTGLLIAVAFLTQVTGLLLLAMMREVQ